MVEAGQIGYLLLAYFAAFRTALPVLLVGLQYGIPGLLFAVVVGSAGEKADGSGAGGKWAFKRHTGFGVLPLLALLPCLLALGLALAGYRRLPDLRSKYQIAGERRFRPIAI